MLLISTQIGNLTFETEDHDGLDNFIDFTL